jgi:Zn-dependent M16 (insulinase) family peptidase
VELPMKKMHGFELIRELSLPEVSSQAQLFRHMKTGAELLSLENDDPAKVFGVSFRTIPSDSTGVPHILEHIVLAGSERYPVKDPFIELVKGSLAYFINAWTFEDKTVYPVSSPNEQDFYNLIEVYLDLVFHPLLKHETFKQEGWHYALPSIGDALEFHGVVFNEMKGQLSNPDYILALETQQTLMPDTPYAHRAGGDPEAIPDLTYEDFLEFYRRHYHPSNARFFFYGDDPIERRLETVNEVISPFEKGLPAEQVEPQPPFDQPKTVRLGYPASEDGEAKPIGGVSWLLPVNDDPEQALILSILAHSLIGTPASPLRKALSDSGIGAEVYGTGYEGEPELFDFINQLFFTVGLKGVKEESVEAVEPLILSTLAALVENGIDAKMIEASLNSIEFQLREANYGGLPRGIMYMIGVLSTWNYDRDPLAPLAFLEPLQSIKEKLKQGQPLFEDYVQQSMLDNFHRVFLQLVPDPDFQRERELVERQRLESVHQALNEDQLSDLVAATCDLQELQETPDRPEDLAKLPILRREDLDPNISTLPIERIVTDDASILYHDLPTFGITYLDLGFDLHSLPAYQLPYVPLLGRALIEMGTQKEDAVEIAQRIGRETGGIESETFCSAVRDSKDTRAFLFLRAKAIKEKAGEMLSILHDLLLTPRLDDQERFLQIVLEEKTRKESALIPGGHQFVDSRLRAGFDKAGWVEEQLSGVEYLLFLRRLIPQIETNWTIVLTSLKQILASLLNRQTCLCNLTLNEDAFRPFQLELETFLRELPAYHPTTVEWAVDRLSENEGLTIPAQVNYVGKGAQIYEFGYQLDGSIHVILGHLRLTYLWEKVRILGGAYGAFCAFDPLTGGLTHISYRDPNLMKTLEAYDGASKFLAQLQIDDRELTKAIISTIGRSEPYRLPDAQGFISMARYLTGVTDAYRQAIRDQILGTTASDFYAFEPVLAEMAKQGRVVILGSKERLEGADLTGNGLEIKPLL